MMILPEGVTRALVVERRITWVSHDTAGVFPTFSDETSAAALLIAADTRATRSNAAIDWGSWGVTRAPLALALSMNARTARSVCAPTSAFDMNRIWDRPV